jgi:hypothetical protein
MEVKVRSSSVLGSPARLTGWSWVLLQNKWAAIVLSSWWALPMQKLCFFADGFLPGLARLPRRLATAARLAGAGGVSNHP